MGHILDLLEPVANEQCNPNALWETGNSPNITKTRAERSQKHTYVCTYIMHSVIVCMHNKSIINVSKKGHEETVSRSLLATSSWLLGLLKSFSLVL